MRIVSSGRLHRNDRPGSELFGFSSTCTECHTTLAWSPSTYSHDVTGFPLEGAHASTSCSDCHTASNGSNPPTDCYTCHRGDYEAVTSPDHADAGFSLSCELCHSTAAWIPADFNEEHSFFPLTGAHGNLTCTECHTGDGYQGLSSECASCHQDDFTETTDPDHELFGFSSTCTECHTTLAWSPSTFSHDITGFPLEGAHASALCSSCHTAAYGKKPPTDCYACHQQEYNNAPGHTANSFPLNCLECHVQTAWGQVTFTHDEFPIYSGAHRNVWSSCTDCHPTAGNYGDFTCLTCHGRTRTEREHDEVNGYQYSSPSCYACHPDGDE